MAANNIPSVYQTSNIEKEREKIEREREEPRLGPVIRDQEAMKGH